MNVSHLLIAALVFFGLFSCQSNSPKQQTIFQIEEAGMHMKLPNSQWNLKQKVNDGDVVQYFLFRETGDSELKPSMQIFVYTQLDSLMQLNSFVDSNLKELEKFNIEVNKVIGEKNETYPLSLKNAQFIVSNYDLGAGKHQLNMIQYINDNHVGIQIYFDCTESYYPILKEEIMLMAKSVQLN